MQAMTDSDYMTIERRRAIMRSRARSLRDEGYMTLYEVDNTQLFMTKLRHHHNGHTIIITAYPIRNIYTQAKDGKVIVDKMPIL